MNVIEFCLSQAVQFGHELYFIPCVNLKDRAERPRKGLLIGTVVIVPNLRNKLSAILV